MGLTRMDAALDAMRPMGFPTDAVLKSVKKLLKVYGNDGWAFIEEAAYKLLIDTILEEPEVDELDHETGLPPLEGSSQGSHEEPVSGGVLCDKEVPCDELREPSCALGIHGLEMSGQDVKFGLEGGSQGSLEQPASGNELCDKVVTCGELKEPSCAFGTLGSEMYGQDVKFGQQKVERQDSGFEVAPLLLQDVKDRKETWLEVGFAPAFNPRPVDKVLTDKWCRPCYGWISDDEDVEMVQATPSSTVTTDLAA